MTTNTTNSKNVVRVAFAFLVVVVCGTLVIANETGDDTLPLYIAAFVTLWFFAILYEGIMGRGPLCLTEPTG